MPSAMTLVSTVTVGAGGASTIDFTSIPQTGTDLLIVLSGRATAAQQDSFVNLSLNGSTTGFSGKQLDGNGTTVGTANTTRDIGKIPAASSLAGVFGNRSLLFPNYSSSENKSFSLESVTENNTTANSMHLTGGIWANTAAITSVSLSVQSSSFAQNSAASLYIITKGSGGATVS